MAQLRCEHDSGSATGNRPLCTDKATHRVTYRLVGMGVTITVANCQRHVKTTQARVHPYECVTEKI